MCSTILPPVAPPVNYACSIKAGASDAPPSPGAVVPFPGEILQLLPELGTMRVTLEQLFLCIRFLRVSETSSRRSGCIWRAVEQGGCGRARTTAIAAVPGRNPPAPPRGTTARLEDRRRANIAQAFQLKRLRRGGNTPAPIPGAGTPQRIWKRTTQGTSRLSTVVPHTHPRRASRTENAWGNRTVKLGSPRTSRTSHCTGSVSSPEGIHTLPSRPSTMLEAGGK